MAWRLRNTYGNYTPEEVLQIFREEYRLVSFIDIEVDEGQAITEDMTIAEWRGCLDFLPWRELYKAENTMFKIDLPYETWMDAIQPEGKKTVWDLCVFVAQHARKEIIHPKRILGRDCLDAAAFLTLKKNLVERGIDAGDIRPSTRLRDLLTNRTFPHALAEIVLTGARTFESLDLELRSDISFWRKVNIFASDRYCVDTGLIATFGDLSRKIARSLAEDGQKTV